MELEFLSTLAVQPGPFVTVYLDTSHNTPDAERRIDLEWRDARRELQSLGADEATLTVVDKAVETSEPAVGEAGKVLVAAHGELFLERDLPAPPRRRIARLAPLPHLMPLLAQQPDPLPYLVVVADRGGADIRAYAGPGESLDLGDAGSVSGPDQWPLHKVPTGGWAALRYQHAVEVAWERNASAVAAHVGRVAEAVAARLVILAGDVRARTLLKDALAQNVAALVAETDTGSRHAGSDDSALQAEVDRLVVERLQAERSELVDRIRQGFTNDTAVQGLEAVFGALREGMVDTAVVVDDPRSDATAVVGPDPLQVALNETGLAGYGVSVERDRADAALLRALAASGAKIEVFTDDHPTDDDLNPPPADADDQAQAQAQRFEFTDGIAALVRRQGAGLY